MWYWVSTDTWYMHYAEDSRRRGVGGQGQQRPNMSSNKIIVIKWTISSSFLKFQKKEKKVASFLKKNVIK